MPIIRTEARIAFLQGERKGQENLKNDLVRRIKMLEYALKQERSKFHKLKYGTDLNELEYKSPYENETKDEDNSSTNQNKSNNNMIWKQSRHLLRQYLQEIGFTDTIIDVRAARVRQLLGLPTDGSATSPVANGLPLAKEKRPNDGSDHREPNKKVQNSVSDNMMMDSENSVMASFDFLSSDNVVDDEEENMSDGENEENDDDDNDEKLEQRKAGDQTVVSVEEMMTDADTEEALAEFNFLVTEQGKRSADKEEAWAGVNEQHIRKMKDKFHEEKQKGNKKAGQRPSRAALQEMLANLSNDTDLGRHGNKANVLDDSDSPRDSNSPEDSGMEAALGLGELAGLTVNNDAESIGYETEMPVDSLRKTWTAKYTLRSHFDGVRALAFHPVEPVLVTASEDFTLKLWNLQKTVLAKKSASLDVEPVYTFRAHRGPVLSLVISPTGETCYSGGTDATIRCWNMPNSSVDPYDLYDASVLQHTLTGHTDAVWGLAIHSHKMHLLSCSADGSVCLWDPSGKTPLLSTFRVDDEKGVPTAVDCVRCDPNHMVVSYTSSKTYLFDIETGKQLLTLDTVTSGDLGTYKSVNHVLSHPTLPVTITAHEDRSIKFTDNNTGKVVHSMMAHLDAVTSLAIDPNGLYLLSGSHDCSVRLWNLDQKTCVQEITAHRKKHDESIHCVAFHPSKPYIASAGADALAKVYV